MTKLVPRIVHTAPHYLALHKPAGLVSDQQWDYPSVEGWVRQYLVAQGVKKPYVGMVHRLDRVTSGLMLVATRKSSLRTLQEQFQERRVRKFYRAQVESLPPQTADTLEHHIEKNKTDKKAIIHERPTPQTQVARLAYRVLDLDKRLLSIELFTGRFHQIRAQLSAIGCPIIGDKKYGASMPFGEYAIALQASEIHFFDPQTGAAVILQTKQDF